MRLIKATTAALQLYSSVAIGRPSPVETQILFDYKTSDRELGFIYSLSLMSGPKHRTHIPRAPE